MPNYYTVLTQQGAALIAAAQVAGTSVNLTEIAVGDGGGVYTNPDNTATALTNETWRGALNQIQVDANNPSWVIIEALVPQSVGGWMVREVGLFDDLGNLIAIGQYPETYKPVLSAGAGKDLYIRMIMEVSSAAAVTLQIDPSIVLAPRSYVDAQDALLDAKHIKWLGVQTASYVAAAQDGVPFDNTAGANSLTLPPNPIYGQEVWFHDVAGVFKTNALTVIRNGNLLMGLAEDSIVSTNNIKAGAKFYGATIGWRFFV